MDARDEPLAAPLHVGGVSEGGESLRLHPRTTAHRLFEKRSGLTRCEAGLQTSAILFEVSGRNLQEVGLTVAFKLTLWTQIRLRGAHHDLLLPAQASTSIPPVSSQAELDFDKSKRRLTVTCKVSGFSILPNPLFARLQGRDPQVLLL